MLTVSDSTCTLERGLCTWSNTQNMNRDRLDWELTSSELEKHYPVPHEDHTLGTERGKRSQHDHQKIHKYVNVQHRASKYSSHPLSRSLPVPVKQQPNSNP